MRWKRHLRHVDEMGTSRRILLESIKGRDHLGNLNVNVSITLNEEE
jgi:hypothetical protein